jgi:pre-mRNA-processing factor SLU7
MASSQGQRLSREDYKKAKELEELRKSGSAPPELDEEGKMINPHVPQYISVRPWYVNDSVNRPGLKHQRKAHFVGAVDGSKRPEGLPVHLKAPATARPAATKFRPGACENCGAMTHKTKECVERPRARGARWTGRDIAADEAAAPPQEQGFEAKRDRWSGYDPSRYKAVVEHYERTEQERLRARIAEIEEKLKASKTEEEARAARKQLRKLTGKAPAAAGGEGGGEGAEDSLSSDEDDEEEAAAASAAAAVAAADGAAGAERGKGDDVDEARGDKGAQVQKFDVTTRTTVRNLRMREDTAKYLFNLDPNSAYYDPKTRSMRENPLPEQDPRQAVFAGENFVLQSGDARRVLETQRFAWEASERGSDEVHALANPSAAEAMYQSFVATKEQRKREKMRAVLDRYGGEEHLSAPEAPLLLSQSERYVEYAEDGRVVKGQEESVPRSKYPEDVLERNHTAVWGSYWHAGKWGYACCWQTVRGSYCTGEAGKKAAAGAVDSASHASAQKMQQEPPLPPPRPAAPEAPSALGDLVFSDAPAAPESKAERDAREFAEERAAAARTTGKRARYNVTYDGPAPDDEDMEQYHRTKSMREDPMREFFEQQQREKHEAEQAAAPPSSQQQRKGDAK